jgi:hypothetical protein
MLLTIDEKLPSINTIEDGFIATSVPEIPIDNPISAALSDGGSLVPSTVAANVSLSLLSVFTQQLLVIGIEAHQQLQLGYCLGPSHLLSVAGTLLRAWRFRQNWVVDTALRRNALGSDDVVTLHHTHNDTRLAAVLNCLGYAAAQRVLDATVATRAMSSCSISLSETLFA